MSKVFLKFPFSRKTFDLFRVIKTLHPSVEIVFETNNIFQKSLVFLLYGLWSNQKITNPIIFPQEVDQMRNDHINKFTNNNIFPNIDLCNTIDNKIEFSKICSKLEISHPKTWVTNFNIKTKTKLIFKPNIGSGSKGIYVLEDALGAITVPENYLCQEYVGSDNEIYGFFAFVKNGTVISHYTHKRIETHPKRGGVTVLSEKIENESLKDNGFDVVRKLSYTGLIMIEFKKYNNDWIVIEVNPRLWGSLLFCLTLVNNPISAYLNEFNVKTENNIIKKNTLIWLIPYGFSRLSVWKSLHNSLLINYPFRGGLLAYFWSILLISLHTLFNKK